MVGHRSVTAPHNRLVGKCHAPVAQGIEQSLPLLHRAAVMRMFAIGFAVYFEPAPAMRHCRKIGAFGTFQGRSRCFRGVREHHDTGGNGYFDLTVICRNRRCGKCRNDFPGGDRRPFLVAAVQDDPETVLVDPADDICGPHTIFKPRACAEDHLVAHGFRICLGDRFIVIESHDDKRAGLRITACLQHGLINRFTGPRTVEVAG